MTRFVLVGSALVLLMSSRARADGKRSITFDDVVELARARAPEVRLAAEDLRVARTEREGASVLSNRNPVLFAGAGSRWGDERTIDRRVWLEVPIDLGGQRSKRISAADASIELAKERASDVERHAVGQAAAAYFTALYARDRLALAEERQTLASRLVDTARQRKQAGDAAAFEVNLALGELSRAKSGVASARMRVATARTRLARALGLDSTEGLTLAGALDDWSFVSPASRADLSERTDLRVARARVSSARTRISLADVERWPQLGFRVVYSREERADIAFGALIMTLPLFERGQGARAEARAAHHRTRLETELKERAATAELGGALAAYEAAREAASEMQGSALPLAIESERMARESYAAGKIELAAMLVVRREALDTRAEYLERLLEAAHAAVDLWVAQGAPYQQGEKQ